MPASPSVKALMTGIPPATAASNRSNLFLSSVFSASSCPLCANNALFAVTMSLPVSTAATMESFAAPLWPPISSTKISISFLLANEIGSLSHWYLPKSTPRFLFFVFADTATISIFLPVLACSIFPFCWIIFITPMPTVPNPAIPSFIGLVIVGSFTELLATDAL